MFILWWVLRRTLHETTTSLCLTSPTAPGTPSVRGSVTPLTFPQGLSPLSHDFPRLWTTLVSPRRRVTAPPTCATLHPRTSPVSVGRRGRRETSQWYQGPLSDIVGGVLDSFLFLVSFLLASPSLETETNPRDFSGFSPSSFECPVRVLYKDTPSPSRSDPLPLRLGVVRTQSGTTRKASRPTLSGSL